ncbi:biopolymer transporter ExbD [Aquifex pyrophilus]
MEEKEFSGINVIPLVDIMLVLLTIVLTTATFIVRGDIPVEIPKAESGKAVQEKGIIITITFEGTIYLNSEKVSYEELREKLKILKNSVPVEIRADRSAKVENLVKVLDLLNGLGFKNVSLAVEKSA